MAPYAKVAMVSFLLGSEVVTEGSDWSVPLPRSHLPLPWVLENSWIFSSIPIWRKAGISCRENPASLGIPHLVSLQAFRMGAPFSSYKLGVGVAEQAPPRLKKGRE